MWPVACWQRAIAADVPEKCRHLRFWHSWVGGSRAPLHPGWRLACQVTEMKWNYVKLKFRLATGRPGGVTRAGRYAIVTAFQVAAIELLLRAVAGDHLRARLAARMDRDYRHLGTDLPPAVRNGDILPTNNQLKPVSPTGSIRALAKWCRSDGGSNAEASNLSSCFNPTAHLPACRHG
jgi:hypothetical protein